MTKHQKRVAVITDFSGFGRCSTAVDLPIISAMKIQCCVLPTAVLSAHTGYPSYWLHDFTHHMTDYMNNWKELNLTFDGIGVGYLGSTLQIHQVQKFFEMFEEEDTLVLLDPIMGDDGKLYSSYTPELCGAMRELVPCADVITPNLTEACLLLGIDYDGLVRDYATLDMLVKRLSDMGPSKVVITGLEEEGYVFNYAYDRESGLAPKRIGTAKVGTQRAGSGDVFAAVLFASLVKGDDFFDSVKKAVDFIAKCLKFTEECNTPLQDGLMFEEYLTELK